MVGMFRLVFGLIGPEKVESNIFSQACPMSRTDLSSRSGVCCSIVCLLVAYAQWAEWLILSLCVHACSGAFACEHAQHYADICQNTFSFCHIDIDECESMPCRHDGSCEDYLDGYVCDCAVGYTGTICESGTRYHCVC